MLNFSVLMSVYYKENPEFLVQSLDSVFSQDIQPVDVVLVEDGPLTDALYGVIDKYVSVHPNLKLVPLKENQGLGKALNEGILHCSQELVARMDTDDICKPGRFAKELKVFEDNPNVDVCGAWVDEFIDTKENIQNQRRLPEFHDEIYKFSKSRCPVNHPTVMYRKSRVLKVNGYQGFPEDIYLWVKMLMDNCVFYNIQESLLWFRVSKELYRRRGGWSYAKQDLESQWAFYKCGFIGFPMFLKNSITRICVRLMPNSLRSWVYKNFLRQ